MLFFFLASVLFNKELLRQTLPFSHTPHAPYLSHQTLWLWQHAPVLFSEIQEDASTQGDLCPSAAEGHQWVTPWVPPSRGWWGPGLHTRLYTAAFWQWRTKAQTHFRPCGGHASVLRSFRPILSQCLSRAGLFTLCLSLADSLLILALFPVSVLPQRTWLPPKPLHFFQVHYSCAIVLLPPLHPSLSAFPTRSLPQTTSTSLPRGSPCPPLNLHSAYSFGL